MTTTATLGRFSDENLTLTATLGGGDWSGALPLANLQDETRFVSAPARQLHPNDPTKARIEATLERDRTINFVGVLFHTLGPSAEYRLTLAGPEGSFADPVLTIDWTAVHGRMFPSTNLPWEEPNWWLGLGRPEDLLLYPQHLRISLPATLVSAVRIEFRDPDAAYFDVGGLWICGAWSPRFNYDHGRELGLESRTLSDESPSGRIFHEARANRRRLTVTWSMLDQNEGLRLFDAGAKCGTRRPVILLPDLDDPVMQIREAFPATFEKPPALRRGRKHENVVSATFKEIIA